MPVYLHPDVHGDERFHRRWRRLVAGAVAGRHLLCVETPPGLEADGSHNGAELRAPSPFVIGIDTAGSDPATLACAVHQMADVGAAVETAAAAGRHGKLCAANFISLAALTRGSHAFAGAEGADVVARIADRLAPGAAEAPGLDDVLDAAAACGGLPGRLRLEDVRRHCRLLAGAGNEDEMRRLVRERVTVRRERAMADNIAEAASRNPGLDVHVVVGAGHLMPDLPKGLLRELGVLTAEFERYHSGLDRAQRLVGRLELLLGRPAVIERGL